MTELEMLLQSHRGQILEAARKHGAYDVRVFGSVARGDARPDSDIDFLVRLESGRSLLDLARLLRELQSFLGPKVDIVTDAGLRPRIRPHVLREARPLREVSRNGFWIFLKRSSASKNILCAGKRRFLQMN